MNTGALSGGAPDGAPALDAAERDRAKITLESIDLYVTPLDAEIDAILDKVDPEQIIDPPDDVFIAPVLRKRLEQVGGIGWDQEGEFAVTDDMTPAQLVELEQVELNIRVWALNSEATEPGWMIRTLRKREKYLDALNQTRAGHRRDGDRP